MSATPLSRASVQEALAAETDQHEAFYMQDQGQHSCNRDAAFVGGRLSRLHEAWHLSHEEGIAKARALLAQ